MYYCRQTEVCNSATALHREISGRVALNAKPSSTLPARLNRAVEFFLRVRWSRVRMQQRHKLLRRTILLRRSVQSRNLCLIVREHLRLVCVDALVALKLSSVKETDRKSTRLNSQ